MRGAYVVAVTLLVAASGCLGPASPEGEEDETSVRTSQPASGARGTEDWMVHNYSATFDRTVQGFSLIFNTASINSRNCVKFLDGVQEVLHGNATATWSANSQLSERLEVVAYGTSGSHSRGSGTAPLTVPFQGLVPQPGQFGGVTFLVQLTDPGVAVDQAVGFHLEFAYEGAASLNPDTNWSCSVG